MLYVKSVGHFELLMVCVCITHPALDPEMNLGSKYDSITQKATAPAMIKLGAANRIISYQNRLALLRDGLQGYNRYDVIN